MFCAQCGKEISDNVKFCPNCGQEVKVIAATSIQTVSVPPNQTTAATPVQFDDGWHSLIPRNKYALISYYVGLFSMLLGIIMGPIAIVCGIMGLNYAKKNRAAKGAIHAGVGIGCGSIALLFWLLIIITMIAISR